jgi:hypothetical protein
MKRRHFLQTSGLALGSVLIGNSVLALNTGTRNNILSFPDKVTALQAGKEISLFKIGKGIWGAENLSVL